MINYSCDLCGSECNDKIFTLPIAATFIGVEPCDVIPVNVNLCKQCRKNIYKTIDRIGQRDKIANLNKCAIDIKMCRSR